eukprot:7480714-Heterocapsa_arctica.AAC.1
MSAIVAREDASRKLCNLLRRGGRGRVKTIDDGGWVKCKYIIKLNTRDDLPMVSRNTYWLEPSGVSTTHKGSKRNASNFNAYLPDDHRNVVKGRDQCEYDAVIVLRSKSSSMTST